MKDDRFLHPLSVFDYRSGQPRPFVAFRVRNHLIPCTTRQMKTLRRKVRILVAKEIDLLTTWEEKDQLSMTPADFEFFNRHVRPRIGQPPVYNSISGRPTSR